MPENGEFSYIENNITYAKLFPFNNKDSNSSVFIYELMKQLQPDVVITIRRL